MLNATEMLEGLSKYKKSPALYLYPWVLAWIVWMKSSGSQSDQIPFDIPVVQLYDFSHPDKIPEKDFPYAIDGERYYFTKQVPLDASGKRSNRKAGKEGAFWKSTSNDIEITDLNEKVIGYMKKYTLCEAKDEKGSAKSTNWHMEEYMVLDPDGPVDQYVLCKIYDKYSRCPKYTDTSIRTLTKRFIERQLGSHQTESIPWNSNLSQTQFDNNNFGEDLIMQQTLPTSESFPLDSILPIPRPPGYSNGFSMSHDASGNQNRPESIPWNINLSQTQFDNNNFGEDLIMQQTLPTSESFPLDSILPIPRPPGYSNGFSTSHDASGNQNRPESIPWNINLSQTQFDNNFGEDLIMQQTLPTSESFPLDSILPIPRPPGYSNGFSTSHDASGNQNRPESIPWNINLSQTQFDNNNFGEDLIMQQTLPTSESFPLDSILPIPRPPGYSNGFSASHDASGNQNRSESIPPIPRNSILMNQSQTQLDNNNFAEDLIMQQTLPTSENFLSDSILPPIPCSYSTAMSPFT